MALRLATLLITEVIFSVLTADMLVAVAVVAALPKLIVLLTLRASLIFNELIDMEAPESPLVDM